MYIMSRFSRKQIVALSVAALAIAAIAIAAISVCCSHHTYPRELVVADSLCESNPDSAETLLHRVPDSVLAAKPDRMYYDLLRIKASNNLYEPQKDSTIFRIVDFFERYGDKERLCQAYYYQGKYYVQHNDAPQALKCFQKALDMSDDNTPLAFKSKIYSQSGTLFFYQNLFDDAIAMYEKSFKCDSVLNDTVDMVHSLRDMAQTLRHMDKKARSEQMLVEAYDMSKKIKDKALTQTISLVLASLYLDNNEVNRAYGIFCNELKHVDADMQSPVCCLAMEIYFKENRMDSVYSYCKQLMSNGTLFAKETALKRLIAYYNSKGDSASSNKCVYEYISISDSIRKISAVETVSRMHNLYNYGLKEKENTELRIENIERLYALGFVILFSSLLIVILAYINVKRQKRIIEFKRLNEHLAEMNERACVQNRIITEKDKAEISRLKEILDKQGAEQLDVVNEYQNRLSMLEGIIREKDKTVESERIKIFNIISNSISKNKIISPDSWNEIYEAMDISCPQFKKKLFELSSLKSREYKICILVKLGLQNSDIATVMCRKANTITYSRANLYKKILGKEGTAKDFDKFIKSL